LTRYLHIVYDSKVIDGFSKVADFVNPEIENTYFLFNKECKNILETNIRCIRPLSYMFFVEALLTRKYDCIYVHMFNFKASVFLHLSRIVGKKKFIWILWGADLYNLETYKRMESTKDTIKTKVLVKEWVIKKSLSKTYAIATMIKYDYLNAKSFLNRNHIKWIPFNYYPVETENAIRKKKFSIMVGNSGSKSNLHEVVFDKIRALNYKGIVTCPLSYGDINYIKQICTRGQNLFGKRFIPLLEKMGYDKYKNLLATAECAIFNHTRQEGFGNIILCLSLGVKVFMRKVNPIYKSLSEMGLTIFAIEDLNSDKELTAIKEEIGLQNRNLLQELFGKEAMNKQYKNLLFC